MRKSFGLAAVKRDESKPQPKEYEKDLHEKNSYLELEKLEGFLKTPKTPVETPVETSVKKPVKISKKRGRKDIEDEEYREDTEYTKQAKKTAKTAVETSVKNSRKRDREDTEQAKESKKALNFFILENDDEKPEPNTGISTVSAENKTLEVYFPSALDKATTVLRSDIVKAWRDSKGNLHENMVKKSIEVMAINKNGILMEIIPKQTGENSQKESGGIADSSASRAQPELKTFLAWQDNKGILHNHTAESSSEWQEVIVTIENGRVVQIIPKNPITLRVEIPTTHPVSLLDNDGFFHKTPKYYSLVDLKKFANPIIDAAEGDVDKRTNILDDLFTSKSMELTASQNMDDPTLKAIKDLEAIIGKEGLNQISGWHQFVLNALSSSKSSSAEVIELIANLSNNLKSWCGFSLNYKGWQEMTATGFQLEALWEFVGTARSLPLPGKRPDFDPDDFGGNGGGSGGLFFYDNEHHKSPIYEIIIAPSTNTSMIGELPQVEPSEIKGDLPGQ